MKKKPTAARSKTAKKESEELLRNLGEISDAEVLRATLVNVLNVREFSHSNEDRLKRIERNLETVMHAMKLRYDRAKRAGDN